MTAETTEERITETEPAENWEWREAQKDLSPDDAALFSEASLAEDWNKPEEDEAWLHLQ